MRMLAAAILLLSGAPVIAGENVARVEKGTVTFAPLGDQKCVPEMDLTCGGHQAPVVGALYPPPGAIARHDAVAWAYARAADRHGVEIHQQTRVNGIELRDGAVEGVHTDKGFVKTRKVLSAVAGWTTHITKMVGLRTPLVMMVDNVQ